MSVFSIVMLICFRSAGNSAIDNLCIIIIIARTGCWIGPNGPNATILEYKSFRVRVPTRVQTCKLGVDCVIVGSDVVPRCLSWACCPVHCQHYGSSVLIDALSLNCFQSPVGRHCIASDS